MDGTTTNLLTVTFGKYSSAKLEARVLGLLDRLPLDQDANVKLLRDRSLETVMVVDAGAQQFYNASAFDLIESFVQINVTIEKDEERLRRAYEPRKCQPTEIHHAKTLTVPYAQVSYDAPSIGPGAKYEKPKYLPEEGAGFYPTLVRHYRFKTPLNHRTRVGAYL